MRIRIIIVCIVIILCFLLGSILETYALPTDNVSFEGAGVAIDLEFPEEAHPAEVITLNLTINANSGLKLQNFTFVIKALVDESWHEVHREQILSTNVNPNAPLVSSIEFTVPQNSNETLYYYMYVQTDKTSLTSTYIFNATHVRTVTYDELLANYSSLLTDYETLLASYNALSTQYGGLNSTYNSLLNQYNSLQATFESVNSSYITQKATYNALETSYDSLDLDYKTLNQTYCSLKTEKDSLGNTVDNRDAELTLTRGIMYVLFAAIVALVALVVYIKKIKSEPYIVIRKE